MSNILSGTQAADALLESLSREAHSLKGGFAVVQVGEHKVSSSYIKEKEKAAQRIRVAFSLFQFPENVSQEKLEKNVKEIGGNEQHAGVLVQLPLPRHLNAQAVLDCIPAEKDVDVLSSAAFGKFALGAFPVLPPTVAAVASLLSQAGVKLEGASVLVVGAGRLVGLPVSLWLTRQGATVAVAGKETKNLAELASKADVIISGVGKAKVIVGDMVKQGAVVIDAGTSVEDGRSKGDVDFDSVQKKARCISPVPGGVGPLTVAHLFANLLALSRLS